MTASAATFEIPARAVTSGPRFHFFGYYDKTPWDASGRHLLTMEADFMERRPAEHDQAYIGLVDLDAAASLPDDEKFEAFELVGTTFAWNWQQGAMLQWRPGSADEILFNDRRDGRFISVVKNVDTYEERLLPLPLYGVNPTGREAISLNFSRLFDVRPGYGYAGVPDPWADDLCPDDDGLYRIDLETGETRLILSLAQAAAMGEPQPGMDTGKHRFNHVQWNTDGTRFAVLYRWTVGSHWRTRLLTLGADGADPYLLSDHEMVSHYDWRDAETILAWARREGTGDRYYLFTDRTQKAEVVGEGVLTVDGHCSFSPDRRTVLTDTYPDKEGYRTLLLFDPATGRRTDIGRFHGPTPPDKEIRCDLHPRWSRDGRQVCIDSVHEGGRRQMYVLDVGEVLDHAV